MSRLCATSEATERAGEEFAAWLEPGDVVLLSGPLGAGKTTFVRGVARALGVRERVTSPTFTLVRPHRTDGARGIRTLLHADVYRLGSLDEALDLALGELVEEDAVALIEWGDVVAAVFGERVVTLEIAVHGDERTLRLAGSPSRERAGLEEWR